MGSGGSTLADSVRFFVGVTVGGLGEILAVVGVPDSGGSYSVYVVAGLGPLDEGWGLVWSLKNCFGAVGMGDGIYNFLLESIHDSQPKSDRFHLGVSAYILSQMGSIRSDCIVGMFSFHGRTYNLGYLYTFLCPRIDI